MQSSTRIAGLAGSVIAAVAVLAGCSRHDDRTVGQQIDKGIENTERKAAEISADARAAGDAASAAVGRTAEAVKDRTLDMTITTKMNSRLAEDRQLSALRIDVDTADGRVTLRGTAPSLAARERATELARGIEGVVSVSNELQVAGENGKPS